MPNPISPSQKILFIDIETVPVVEKYADLPERMKYLWEKKSAYFRKNDEDPGQVYTKAGIYAEFGKVICISCGLIYTKKEGVYFRLKSLFDEDETRLLNDFAELIKKLEQKKDWKLCAHNGKEFDFPYLARRMVINNITLPSMLSIAGKKPWETDFLDTLELWKFGDYKHYTSLDLLTAVLSIPSPKQDMDGSKVAETYYQQNDVDKIVHYCENDVLAVAQVFLRMNNLPLIENENIERIRDLKRLLPR